MFEIVGEIIVEAWDLIHDPAKEFLAGLPLKIAQHAVAKKLVKRWKQWRDRKNKPKQLPPPDENGEGGERD